MQKGRYLRYPNNRVSAFINEESKQTDVVYTPHGLVEKVTDPPGDAGRHTMAYTYNRLGQVKSAQESGHAAAMRYEYNLHGDTTKQTTPKNTVTLFNPDKMGRPLTITDARGKVTTHEYDNVGNLETIKQPTGAGAFTTTSYFYTARNEIDYETDPADPAHIVDYIYDNEGRQSFRHDRRGTISPATPLDSLPIERTAQQSFNHDGTLAERKATGTGLSEHRSVFGYDPDGNPTSVKTYMDGSATPNVSELVAGYTSAGELKDWSETLYPPNGGAAVTKTGSKIHNQDGLQASNTVDGQTSTSTWFLDGNEKAFTPYGGFGSFSSTYYGNGALDQMTFPNAAKLAQRYNAADLATSRVFTNSSGAKLSAWESIGYDENNNRTTETVTQAQPAGSPAVAPGTGTFGYDDLDRLTSFKHPFETTTATYGLDDAGNVVSEPNTTFSFTNNRLVTRTPALPALPSSYGYDHFGNQVSDTEVPLLPTTTSYNAASHTRRVTSPDTSWVEYNYDGLERMVSRHDSAGATVMFFHEGLSEQIALETDAAGAVTTRYLVDAFGVARGKLDIGNSTGRSYYITDPRANVTQMIGASDQAVKAVFAYDPYGKDKPALSKKLTANWDSRLKFQMAPKDPKTGAYNIGPRVMDPRINRFVGSDNYVAAGANLGLQVDPLTGNRYLYAGANPAGMIDDGHSALSPCMGRIGWCAADDTDTPIKTIGQTAVTFAPGYDCVAMMRDPSWSGAGWCAVDFVPYVGKADNVVKAGKLAQKELNKVPAACRANSFVPGTEVLMADGSTKPIEEVEVGDWVWAADPETGEQGPRQVTDLIVGEGDKDLVDIVIANDLVTATSQHPFWVDDQGRWVDAEDLQSGDLLLLADGTSVKVDQVSERSAIQKVHNLTVDGIHTYFVVAGNDEVLVHNCRRLVKHPTPSTPHGLTPNDFGKVVMRWGSGYDEAVERTKSLTRMELKEAGVTRQMAIEWRDFYYNEAFRNERNTSAAGRAVLMHQAARLLE